MARRHELTDTEWNSVRNLTPDKLSDPGPGPGASPAKVTFGVANVSNCHRFALFAIELTTWTSAIMLVGGRSPPQLPAGRGLLSVVTESPSRAVGIHRRLTRPGASNEFHCSLW